ncbi:hypothetical protein RchiOBHm_Chr6g0282961 [Rosa chinensis]|uniref:Uncharacterized protein n=1 Tax=Rosa chinensis TaxID=74649 RepID=A0A2P6PTW7_ROSCH|nr:hypothetical protein RchiOBHm_Chr6g0282961 [Rosa chinensis]
MPQSAAVSCASPCPIRSPPLPTRARDRGYTDCGKWLRLGKCKRRRLLPDNLEINLLEVQWRFWRFADMGPTIKANTTLYIEAAISALSRG